MQQAPEKKRKGFEHTTSKRLKEEFGMKTPVESSEAIVHPDSSEYDVDITEQFLSAPVQLALDSAFKTNAKGISLEIDGVEYKLRSVGRGGKETTHIVYQNDQPIVVAKSAQIESPKEGDLTPWQQFVEPAASAVMHLPHTAEGAENITQVRNIAYDTKNNIGRVEFDFANGGDLELISKNNGLLHEGVNKPEIIAALLEETAKGLRYMHNAGLMHRDIKPANIVLDRGADDVIRAQLTDFGFTSTMLQEQALVPKGVVIGSVPFMDNRVLSHNRDERSDIYALGMTMAVTLFGMKDVWNSFVKEITGKDIGEVGRREYFDAARAAAAGKMRERVHSLLKLHHKNASPELQEVYDMIVAMLNPTQEYSSPLGGGRVPLTLDTVIAVAHEAASKYGGSSVLLENIFPKENPIAQPGEDKSYVRYMYDKGSGSVVPPPPEGISHPALGDEDGDGDVSVAEPRDVEEIEDDGNARVEAAAGEESSPRTIIDDAV